MDQELHKHFQCAQTISSQLNINMIRNNLSEQVATAKDIQANNGVLLTLWVAPDIEHQSLAHFCFYSLYLLPSDGLCCVISTLSKTRPMLPDLSTIFPVANRLQRAIYELLRIPTRHQKDKRAWLNHGHWDIGILNKRAAQKQTRPSSYPFQKVAGDGVHEVPVGPVHAGIIEPGHFRFSVVGERVLKLEERLGFAHKGIHHLLLNQPLDIAAPLVSRISGDTTVAYAWAFAMACEHACQHTTSTSVSFYRAILLERERLANHIGDLGGIVNDTGMPSLSAQFNLLKEKLLRHNFNYTQHRYQMDQIIPFQLKNELSSPHLKGMIKELDQLKEGLQVLEQICQQHNGLQDRLVNTGILTTDRTKQLGVIGVVAKASGIDLDTRRLFSYSPYNQAKINSAEINTGDVTARVLIRFKECFESIELVKQFIDNLLNHTPQEHNNPPATPLNKQSQFGVGCIEGWRGPVSIALSIKNNTIEWCHFHDPSWQNWPALEYAVLNNIIADFPLINKSFNLSYSGHDS